METGIRSMTSDIAQSTLRKMIGTAGEQVGVPSVTRLLRLALERATDEQLGLSFEVMSVCQSKCTPETLATRFPKDAMIGVLEGEAQGAVAVDIALLSGLVEFQTIGRVSQNLPAGRRATKVDAALLAPVLDVALAGFDEAVAEGGHSPWGQGYVFGAMVADTRSLLLALNAAAFHVFEIEVSLCNGARNGSMTLVFAEQEAAVGNADTASGSMEGGEALRRSVLLSPATFSAVIGRLSVPLQQLQTLKAGEMLTLPAGALRDIRLEGPGGEHAIQVSLGQLNGLRAVRLNGAQGPAEAAVPENLAETPKGGAAAPAAVAGEAPPPQNVATDQEVRIDPGEGLEDLNDLDSFLNEAGTDLELV